MSGGARAPGRIVAVDPSRGRLELAGRLGAADRIHPEEVDPVATIHALTEGGVDLAVVNAAARAPRGGQP